MPIIPSKSTVSQFPSETSIYQFKIDKGSQVFRYDIIIKRILNNEKIMEKELSKAGADE